MSKGMERAKGWITVELVQERQASSPSRVCMAIYLLFSHGA